MKASTKAQSTRYPIRAVARLTGLGIDTLRAWERRHRAVVPKRDDRGRMYSEGDVRRLRLLRDAVARGHAIGQIARLGDLELAHLASTGVERDATFLQTFNASSILEALERFDSAGIDAALGRAAAALQPLDLLRDVISPLVGGNPADEGTHVHVTHTRARERLLRAAIRNLLGSLLRLHGCATAPGRLIFATPVAERDEIAILGAALIAASGGLDAVLLGSEVSADDLVSAAAAAEADVVVVGVGDPSPAHSIAPDVTAVARRLTRDVEVWIFGRGAKRIGEAVGPRGLVIGDYDELSSHLTRLGGRPS